MLSLVLFHGVGKDAEYHTEKSRKMPGAYKCFYKISVMIMYVSREA